MWPFRRSRPSTDVVSWTPETPPSDAELVNWDPASRLVALVDRIRPRFESEGLTGLNEVEHTLIALYDLDSEVCNGGFGAWLYQAPRDLVRTAPECLERVEDEHVLNLVRCIFHDLNNDAFALDLEAWMHYLENRGDSFWARINTYDLGFSGVEEHFIRRVWEYAGEHFTDIR